jgi:hypothetical protein
VKDFLQLQTNFKLERERELLPFTDGVDGAYVARLRFEPAVAPESCLPAKPKHGEGLA